MENTIETLCSQFFKFSKELFMGETEEIIKLIHRNYVDLVNNYVRQFPIFDQNFPKGEISAKIIDNSGLLISCNYGSLNPLSYQTMNFLEDIEKFWKTNISSYQNAVASLKVSKTYQTTFQSPSTAFFETVVLQYRLYNEAKIIIKNGTSDIENTVAMVIRNVQEYLAIKDFFEYEGNIPIVVFDIVDFEDHTKNKITLGGQTFSENVQERVKESIDTIFMELLVGDYKNLSPLQLLQFKNEQRFVDLKEIFNIDLLLSYLDYRPMESGFTISEEWNNFITGNQTIVGSDIVAAIVNIIVSSVNDHYIQNQNSYFYRSDPTIELIELYKKSLNTESNRSKLAVGISEEFAIAQSLSLEPYKWISRATPSEIIQFRELNGSEYILKAFAKEKDRIKYASIDEFGDISKSSRENLNEIIREENYRLSKDEGIIKKKFKKSKILFGAGVTVTLATIALPPLLFISIPVGVFSALFGFPTLKDLYHQKIDLAQNKIFQQRPIGFIAKYMDMDSRI